MRVNDVDALGRSELNLDARHPRDLGRPRPGRVHHDAGARLRDLAVGRAVADADDLAAVLDQLGDAGVILGMSAVGDRVLDVGENEPVRVDTPLLHGHRGDHVRRQSRLGLPCLRAGQAAMGMGVLERLETVVDLHRRFHPLDVVSVVRQDRDEEHDAVHQVAGDGHDVACVHAGEPRRVPVVLEVTGTAVDHPARSPAGARAPVALLQQEDREAA